MSEPKIDQEIQERLDHISELSQELEQALVEVMLPSNLKFVPGHDDIENKTIAFFNHCVDNVMYAAHKRVAELWPERIAKDQEPKDQEALITLLEEFKDSIQTKKDSLPPDKKLN